ncbi:hypothetical protein KUTeg_003751 [Tegillarca granosa]|uniref:Beta-1,3-galactosyl-O-glycosyl-glycoprotein beta-1,6-N-acetylglucosaminyltransferase n=1 Tax=Tegillarca granosa TaxID=220873 RepID=A0ABQ9FSH1_TEGGR|nr:hypothetical protein KUTeg_003751 [Tegillarca granosa]
MRISWVLKRLALFMLCITFFVVIYDSQQTLFFEGNKLFKFSSGHYSDGLSSVSKRQVFSVDCKKIIEGDKSEIKKAQDRQKEKPHRISDKEFISLTKDCKTFRGSRLYDSIPVSKEELEFPLAFSILLYKEVDQAERLLRAIYRPQNVYCFHVDGNSPEVVHSGIKAIANCFDNVFVVSSTVDVIYGGYSRLQADLNCMKDLVLHKVKWKYFINLPSQQFPLKTNAEMVKILKIYNGANDIEGITEERRMMKSRYKYVYNTKTGAKTSKKKSTPPHNIKVVKGSAYGVFSCDFVKFILNDQRAKDFLGWTKDISSPDEYFWATLNHNEHLKAPGSYSGVPDKKPWLAVYAAWGGRDRCHGKFVRSVCIFGVGDLPELASKKELFANKFYLDYQPLALDCLEEWLFNKTLNPMPFETFYYSQLPFVIK